MSCGTYTTMAKFLASMVLWCSWLSLLSNTQAVPGSNPGGIIVLPVLWYVLVISRRRYSGREVEGKFVKPLKLGRCAHGGFLRRRCLKSWPASVDQSHVLASDFSRPFLLTFTLHMAYLFGNSFSRIALDINVERRWVSLVLETPWLQINGPPLITRRM